MADSNKKNLIYFESSSMRELFSSMEEWQEKSQKRLLSTNIQKDRDMFCCIALSNPTEVVICNGQGSDQASVSKACLEVLIYE